MSCCALASVRFRTKRQSFRLRDKEVTSTCVGPEGRFCPVPTDFHAQQLLTNHRRVWRRKPALRRIYNEEFFARLISFRRPEGVSLEVGGGPGFLREQLPGLIST